MNYIKKYATNLKFWFYENISPVTRWGCFLWIVCIAELARALSINWEKLAWLCPTHPERSAKKVWVQGGVIYAIMQHRSCAEMDEIDNEFLDSKPDFVRNMLTYSWYCGYVRYPECPFMVAQAPVKKNRKFDLKTLMEQGGLPPHFSTYIPVHGGITYEHPDAAGYVFGFDCNHLDDYNNPALQNMDWLSNEINNMRLAIDVARDEGFEREYNLHADNNQRATVVDKYHQFLQDQGIIFELRNNIGAMLNLMGGEI